MLKLIENLKRALVQIGKNCQKKEKNLNKKSGKKPGLGTEKKSEKIKRRKCMKKGEKMQKDKNRTVKIRFKLTKMQETIDEMSKVVYNSN